MEKIINDIYLDVLGRSVDESGMQTYSKRFRNKMNTIEHDLRRILRKSDEFKKLHVINKDTEHLISNNETYVKFVTYSNQCGIQEASKRYVRALSHKYSTKLCTVNSFQKYTQSMCTIIFLVPDEVCRNIILWERENNPNVKIIGIFVWELHEIKSNIFTDVLNLYDKIIVPTEQIQSICYKHRYLSEVVHHGLCTCGTEEFDLNIPIQNKFVFYTRKGRAETVWHKTCWKNSERT